MAYADDLTFRDNAAADKTFSRQMQEAGRHTWIDQSTTAAEPRIVRIAHRAEPIPGVTGESQDRHTVDFAVTKKDGTTGKLYNARVSIVVLMPRTGPIVRADLDHLVSFVKSATNGFLTSTTMVDKLLRSEL